MFTPVSLLAATVFAFSGIFLGYLYYRSERVRESSRAQYLTLLVILVGAVFAARGSGRPLSISQLGMEGFLLLGASLCHVPTLVWILLFQWNRLLEYLTSPGSRDERGSKRSIKEEWAAAERHLEALRRNPLNVAQRRQLAEAYLRLGLVDSAIGEFRKAIECAERGYEQSHLLFKAARLLVDVKKDIPAAVPLLRRTIRLYPKSYFAAYARRMVNHYDAHGRTGGGRRPRGDSERKDTTDRKARD